MIYTANDWIIFNVVVTGLLSLDLFILGKNSQKQSIKRSLLGSACWFSLALIFNIYIYYRGGLGDALDYFSAYLVEYTLSVDNLFLFVIIFTYFKVPKKYTHKVLFWGIVGAILMRACFIIFGILLVTKFHWILYIFGVFLIYTAYKLMANRGKEINLEHNPFLNWAQRWIPMTKNYQEDAFFFKEKGYYKATPLFLVLLVIESTDLIFAIDSIPAVMGITLDPFIVYTSNIAAILGLRSLYFSLAHMKDRFHYLDEGLAIILAFIGFKMTLGEFLSLPNYLTFSVVMGVLIGSITLSILYPIQNIRKD